MHILFLTDNFPPECNAPATRTYEHALHWIKAGHQVTVVTCFPNFPGGRVYEGYRNQWYSREQMDGIDVVRVKSYMTANERFVRRTLDYLSFMVSGSVAACFQRKPDVIVATSPQFFCGVAGMIVSAIRRKPFILEVRDIWPASIVALGVMKERLSIRLLGKLERLLYKRASRIVVVTHAFRDKLAHKVDDLSKVSVVLNGVEKSMFFPREKDSELLAKYDLHNKFVIGYIGTHGLAHDLNNVLRAVAQLLPEQHITFLFVGAGADRQSVEDTVARENLANVRLVQQQPRENMPAFLSLCDVALIPLRNAPLFSTVIPSKLFENMAMGIPVLMAIPEGEATAIVNDTGCGVVVPPTDPDALAEAVRELANPGTDLAGMSHAALDAASAYTRESLALDMLAVMESCVPVDLPADVPE